MGGGLRALGAIDVREPLAALTDGWGRVLVHRGDALAVRSLSVDGAGRMLLALAGGEVAARAVDRRASLLLQGHAARRGAAGRRAARARHAPVEAGRRRRRRGALRLRSLAHALLATRRRRRRDAQPSRPTAPSSPSASPTAWLLLDAESLRPGGGVGGGVGGVSARRAPRAAASAASFSPCGSMLAVGTADGSLAVIAHAAGGWGRLARRRRGAANAAAIAQLDCLGGAGRADRRVGGRRRRRRRGGWRDRGWLPRTAPAARARAGARVRARARRLPAAAAALASAGVLGHQGAAAAAAATSGAAAAVSAAGIRRGPTRRRCAT